jgi:putative MFS transporter
MSEIKSKTMVISPADDGSSAADGAVTSDAQGAQTSGKRPIDDAPMTPFLTKVSVFSSGGSFLDGYVLSLIGVALTQITPMFNLTSAESGAIGASVMLGILFGTILGGYLTDRIGRKKMFTIDVIAIGVLSILSMFAATPFQLILARFGIGLFVGADYPIATSLIAEFTPRKHRAISMGAVSAAWYLGATVAAVVGYALYPVENGWKWMLGSAVVPCIILLIGRAGIPESPIWLAQKGRRDEADAIIEGIYGPGYEIPYEEESTKVPLRQLLHSGYMKRMVFVAIFIMCQVVPMYAIYTYGPDIMTAFGLGEGRESILGESAVSFFFLVGTIPAMFWLNSMGRRKLVLLSLSMMLIGLLILGIWPTAPIYVVILAFGLYAFFSGGPGILQWLYPNELFPTSVRASAVGICISFTRIFTIISTYGLPVFMAAFGIGPTMLVAAGLVGLGLVLSYFLAPETRDLTLVEASSLHNK